MIKLHEIHKIYMQGAGGFHALKDVSLYFESGEHIVVYGKSGCGKTTLLNIIAGIDRPSSGDMVIDNKLTTRFKESEWDFFRNHRIGFIFQQYNLIEHLPVIENVALSAKIGGIKYKDSIKKAHDMLKRVGLESHAFKRPVELSGGERQRVAIARALVNDPDIILADEPTGALDQKTGRDIMDLLKAMGKDKLIIIVTHNLKLAKAYATRMIELKDGRVVNDTNPKKGKVSVAFKREKQRTSLSFKEGLRMAWFNIMARKWRTSLIAFGLALGIVALMVVDALFNTIRAGIEAPINRLKENPEILISLPYDGDQTHQSIIDDIEMNHPFFNDLSPQKQGLSIVENVTTGSIFMNPVNVDNYQARFESSGVIAIYDAFIEDGRFPENTGEIALPIHIARNLFNINLHLTDQEIWETLEGQQFLVATTYNYIPDNLTEDDLNTCMIIEDWDDNPGSLPASFDGRFGDYATHMETLRPYRSTPLNITHPLTQENITLFCDDYDAFVWSLDSYDPIDFETLTLVGITNRNHIRKAFVHDSFVTDISFQPALLNSDFDFIPSGNYLQVRGYLDAEHINQKATILNTLEDHGYRVTDVQEQSFDFFGNLTIFFTYIVQFIFSAIVSIAVITAGLMLLLILYISVLERTHEIGLIRAMGGTRKDIRTIFAGETTMIGLFAGLMSILILLFVTLLANTLFNDPLYRLISNYFENLSRDNMLTLDYLKMLYAVIGSVLIAIISGIIPSVIASRKQPIDALRND